MSLDMRVTRAIPVGERVRLDLIAEGLIINRFNEGSASPFSVTSTRLGSEPVMQLLQPSNSRLRPRQFQFGLKLNF